MINWLKRHFIPHNDNGHKPHFFHSQTLKVILIGILLLEGFVFLLPGVLKINLLGVLNTATVLPGAMDIFVNQERQLAGLTPLKTDQTLTRAAQMKADDMASKGYFAHTSPEGKTPWYWLEQAGYPYSYAGENLAINFNDSKAVVSAWMNSPTHKENIIKGVYSEMGTGVAFGKYNGRDAVFVAQVYANRSKTTKPIVVEDTKIVSEPKNDIAVNIEMEDRAEEVLGTEISIDDTKEKEILLNDTSENVTPVKISLFERIISSPQTTTRNIVITILAISFVALILKIFIYPKIQHTDTIIRGLFVIILLIAIILVNDFVSKDNVILTKGIDYNNQTEIYK